MPTENANVQKYTVEGGSLSFNFDKAVLTCMEELPLPRKKWVKKLNQVQAIGNILEDDQRYYISCVGDDIYGSFLAIYKDNGSTAWYIPGKSFMQVLYGGYLYLIFVNEESEYYLIKVECKEGKPLWHHLVEEDLYFYHFTERHIILHYTSGRRELVAPSNGESRVALR